MIEDILGLLSNLVQPFRYGHCCTLLGLGPTGPNILMTEVPFALESLYPSNRGITSKIGHLIKRLFCGWSDDYGAVRVTAEIRG